MRNHLDSLEIIGRCHGETCLNDIDTEPSKLPGNLSF
jgi:hypothetical protein